MLGLNRMIAVKDAVGERIIGMEPSGVEFWMFVKFWESLDKAIRQKLREGTGCREKE